MWHDTYVLWFSDVDTHSSHSVGTHAQQLAKLTKAHFPIAPGFIITEKAYETFLKQTILDHKIKQLLSTISIERSDSLMQGEYHIKKLFEQAQLPEDIRAQLIHFYTKLGEDEVTLSLHEKELGGRKHASAHIKNEAEFIIAVKDVWAEMFVSSALWHRHHKQIDHVQSYAEIIVQKKIYGDTTGVITTIDPTTHTKDKLVIITTHPHEGDRYIISKKNLSIIDRSIAYGTNLPKLTHDEILTIADMAKELEEYLYFPQAVTWALSGEDIYITETKPISTLAQQQKELQPKIPVARGKGLTNIIGTGKVTIVHSPSDIMNANSQDVLVLSEILFKQIKHLKKVTAIISESHPDSKATMIELKHLGIPTITHVKDARKHLHHGHIVTVHGGKGEIYSGGMIS